MKKKILYIALALISLSSCNDSFLDRLPETSLVTENFFRSPSDLALFVNKLYLSESPKYWDPGTDNVFEVTSHQKQSEDGIGDKYVN